MNSLVPNVHYIDSIADAPTVQAAFESLGPTLDEVLRRLAPDGHVWWFGQATRQPAQINFFEHLVSTPWHLHHFAHWVKDRSDQEDLALLAQYVAAGTIRPPAHHLVRPDEVPQAIAQIIDDTSHSKAVIDYTYSA